MTQTYLEKLVIRLFECADAMPAEAHIQEAQTDEEKNYEAAFNELRQAAENLKDNF